MGSTTIGGSGQGNSRTLTPNTQLQNGRYVVEKVLGQGGMGAAVLARDTRVSNKRVVIKELVSDGSNSTQRQEDVRNFEREVEMLASLDHPLVPTVTDSFQEGSRYYMVQEYAPGENLEDHMEHLNKPMPEKEALTYISQVLDILDYLSQQVPPVVHRDIKPANIIISARDHRARLVDFGIARADEAKNARRKQTSALGTPGYAPPEQYQGNADGRSDLYALAATMHHLVTNRDPRNFPPFSYPPARSLNPQVSPELEHVLERALAIDVKQRYQSAAAMKHDIDNILQQRFHSNADTSSYMLNTSRPLAAVPPATPAAPASQYSQGYSQGTQPRPQPVQNNPRTQPRQVGAFASQPYPQRQSRQQSNGNNYLLWSFGLLILVVLVIGGLIFALPYLSNRNSAQSGSSTGQNGSGVGSSSSDPISASTVNGELLGLSYGKTVFDTSRPDCKSCDYKQQAAAKLAQGDSAGAQSLWRSALSQDSSDAEAHIYLENQSVLASGRPYITLAVGTILTGPNASVGRENLQGAYVAQKEFNADNGAKLGGVEVRLLVANAGGSSSNVQAVANQIVQAAQKDPTIVGVMGWPFSAHAINASQVFTSAKIPMVAQSASSDDLTNISSYFFRVVPPNSVEAAVGARYAKEKLGAQKVVVFSDPSDSYSRSLAEDFSKSFTAGGGQVAKTINYKRGDAQSISTGLQQLTSGAAPDLIYFAGYAVDINTILAEVPTSQTLSNTKILGGDALYELGGYDQRGRAGFNRLHFTAFAYPDEWSILGKEKPAFFQSYIDAFSASNPQGSYGFTRPSNNVMLSYDATLALLTGVKNGLNGGKSLKPEALQQALQQIKGANALQGVSGQISFGPDGNPADKPVVVLAVSSDGHIQMEPQLGAGKLVP
jgi:serine/threonine protein kinase